MLSVDKVVDSWPEYGIREMYLAWNGRSAPWKLIVRGDELVHIAGRRYTVLPLEASVKAADLAMTYIGGSKLHEYYNPRKTRVYVTYDMGRDAEPIRGVMVRLGLYVYNSIDGGLSFGASVMNILQRLGERFYAFMPSTRAASYLSPEVAVAIIKSRHLPKIESLVKNLVVRLIKLVERGLEAIALYRMWSEIEVDRDIALNVYKRLPMVYVPSYIKAAAEGVTLTELMTVWDAYVDISSKIWAGGASIDRKMDLYKMLYDALPRKGR